MIGFVISSHGQFGLAHPDGSRDEGSSVVFSCGHSSPIDVLLKEFIVRYHFLIKKLEIVIQKRNN